MSGIAEAAGFLRDARRVLFITGAGISADSGLPTYRGIGGLYTRGDTEDGIPIEEALSGPVFARNPALTWKYLAQIEHAARGHSHNKGHEVIARMEKRFEQVTVLTQNVDGYHTDAGSTDVIEIHGNMRNLMCTGCSWRRTIRDYTEVEIPPSCGDCGAAARPVLMRPAVAAAPSVAASRAVLVSASLARLAVAPSAVAEIFKGRDSSFVRRGRRSIRLHFSELRAAFEANAERRDGKFTLDQPIRLNLMVRA